MFTYIVLLMFGCAWMFVGIGYACTYLHNCRVARRLHDSDLSVCEPYHCKCLKDESEADYAIRKSHALEYFDAPQASEHTQPMRKEVLSELTGTYDPETLNYNDGGDGNGAPFDPRRTFRHNL